LALARTGHRVTVVERDDTPLPGSVDAAFAWDRRGAPQVRHSHGFAARLHGVLVDRFPDVLDDLRAAGVVEHDLGALVPAGVGGTDGLTVLAARRTTYEWVLRRAVLRSPAVALRVGVAVAGVAVAPPDRPDAPPRVTGIVLADGTELAADAVVAAAGPRSEIGRWLAPHGVDVPEIVAPTGITYLSRFYRLRPGRTLPGGMLSASRRAGLSYSCVEADNGTYSLTLAVDSDDGELRRHLLDPDRFAAVCRLLPGIEGLTDAELARPMTDVHAMGGLINRLRRFVDGGGRPLVAGLHAVGDAHTTTNPVYGRGCALAMVQAVLLSDAFAAHPADPVARARDYEAASAREIEPWYHFAVDGDALRAGTDDVDPHDPRFTLQDLMRAGVAEPALLPVTLRVLTLLDTPDAVATDARFAATLAAVRIARAERVAARRAAGDRPAVTRADLLRAGDGRA
jgi:2-polyprenyl-6-methoxyphenol hydroxylase-like FAD-dependent oxidoreductase